MSSTTNGIISAAPPSVVVPAKKSLKKYTKRIGYGALRHVHPPTSSSSDTDAHRKSRRTSSNGRRGKDKTEHDERKALLPGGSSNAPRPTNGRAAVEEPELSDDEDSDVEADCCGGGGGVGEARPVNRNCVVFMVFLAMLLDSLLLTCMAPILPNYLRSLEKGKGVTPTSNPSSEAPNLLLLLQQTSLPGAGGVTDDWTTPEKPSSEQRGASEDSQNNNNMVDKRRTENLLKTWINVTTTVRPESSYDDENTRIAILFASKTLVQVISNLFVGPLTGRIGYTMPMFCGLVVLLISTVAFAFGESYEQLFAARAFQGVGTALSTTSGMGLLASLFPDQTERAVAQTKAFSGLTLGVFLGPPYGGVLYDFLGGKQIPCLILAGLVVFEAVVMMCVLSPTIERQRVTGPSLLTLLMDPYIVVTAATITISNLTTAVLEPALPIWMYYTMHASTWLQGVAFVPNTVSYLLFLQILGRLTPRLSCFKVSNRWASTMFGMGILAVSISTIAYCKNFYTLMGPQLVMGFGLAQVSTCMLPHIGTLVDQRHQPVYGSAYAITDNAFALAFVLGPVVSGPLVDMFGFTWTLRGLSLFILLAVPLVLFLKDPPGRHTEEHTLLVTSSSVEAARSATHSSIGDRATVTDS